MSEAPKPASRAFLPMVCLKTNLEDIVQPGMDTNLFNPYGIFYFFFFHLQVFFKKKLWSVDKKSSDNWPVFN